MSTSGKFPFFWPLATLVIGLGAGWFGGRQGGPGAAADPQAGRDAIASKTEVSGRDTPAAGGDRNFRSSRAESKQLADSVRSIFRENVEERRFSMFESMLEKMRPEQLPLVVSLIRENDLRGSGSGGEWSRLWSSWGKRDPLGAMEFIRNHDWQGWNRDAAVEAKNRTLTYWSQTDPEAARKFVEEGKELAEGDRSLVYGLVRGWSTVDPEAAAQWLFKSGLGMSGEYKTVVEAISRKGGQEGLDDWFEGLKGASVPEKDLRGFAQMIADTKQAYQADKAAAWVEQNLNEPWLAESGIVDSTARAMAERDPAAAMDWAQRTGLAAACDQAMFMWSRQDPQAAGEWLTRHANDPGYSKNAAILATQLQRSDPAASQKWAESIPDEELRARMLKQLGGK